MGLNDETFGVYVRKQLAERGMRQKDLAIRAGLSPSTISRLLRNNVDLEHGPSWRVFAKIVRALELDLVKRK